MKFYAILPAAGRSRRMGRPKLLLPWPDRNGGTSSIIDRVLQTWTTGSITGVVVVVDSTDRRLVAACRRWPVSVVSPDSPTEDMKASIQVGLRHLKRTCDLSSSDWCFLAPADLPTLRHTVIEQMVGAAIDPTSVVVPVYGDAIGHPVLLPTAKMAEIETLGPREGVNQIVARSKKTQVIFPADDKPQDIDTYEEYTSLRTQWNHTNDR